MEIALTKLSPYIVNHAGLNCVNTCTTNCRGLTGLMYVAKHKSTCVHCGTFTKPILYVHI